MYPFIAILYRLLVNLALVGRVPTPDPPPPRRGRRRAPAQAPDPAPNQVPIEVPPVIPPPMTPERQAQINAFYSTEIRRDAERLQEIYN